MPTQSWLRLKRLIAEIRRDYPQSAVSGPNIEPGIDIYWDGDGLTIEVCRNPDHAMWKKHAHRGLHSSDSASGEVVVSQE